MTQIQQALQDVNPWWKGTVEFRYVDREIYGTLQKYIVLPQIIALTGLRRVGKTTLLRKFIQDRLEQGFEAQRVVYFSFDEYKDVRLRDVLVEYEKLSGMVLTQGRYFLVFDEIQKVKNWEQQLKSIYDTFTNVKIIISGSESLFVRQKSKAVLAGRLFDFIVYPLTFREFLRFKNILIERPKLYERELGGWVREYMLTQGFPELIGISDREIITKYLQESIVLKVIYQDIPELFSVKDVSALQALLRLLMDEPGQLVDLVTLANDLKLSRQTVALYLRYLEQSFLVRKLYNYSKNKGKVERKLKKYYPAIVSPSLLFHDDVLSQSKVLEWFVVTQLRAEFFWRDSRKNEVDVVLIQGERVVPVEVKYGKIEMEGILAFMNEFTVKKGYIVSHTQQEIKTVDERRVEVLPVSLFLLDERFFDKLNEKSEKVK